MTWTCAQLDARRDDYLDGRLAAAELRAADAHARACAACAELYDARRAAAWLRQLELLESPPGLETRILALTVAPPPQESAWTIFAQAWRGLQQPRVAMGLAAAVFSLALGLNALGVSARDIEAADLNPVNLYRGVVRQANLTYARGARFVNDLRLVYEIRSRLEEMAPESEAPPAQTPPANRPPASSPPEPKNQNKGRDGARSQWLLAAQQILFLGELR